MLHDTVITAVADRLLWLQNNSLSNTVLYLRGLQTASIFSELSISLRISSSEHVNTTYSRKLLWVGQPL